MSNHPNRRRVLSWLSATAAVGCAPTSMGLPTKSSFAGSGTASPDTDTDTDSPSPGTTDTGPSTDTGPATDTASIDDTGDNPDTGTSASTEWTCDQGEAAPPSTCSASSPQGEGPYYLDDVPEGDQMNRRGAEGLPLTVDLRVLNLGCIPVQGVVVDLWHADETEVYDMTSDHHCRGRLTTSADGSVCFVTLRPPPYGDGMGNYLPAHLHLNLIIDGAKVLTTQLYFSDCPYLGSPPPELICTPDIGDDGSQRIQVDLVLPTAA